MNSAEWRARVDADNRLTSTRAVWTRAAESRRHCPSCFRAVGQRHDVDCPGGVFGLVVEK